jgi:hypothetical protein
MRKLENVVMEELIKDVLKVAYFCRPRLMNKLQSIRTTVGDAKFKEILNFLERLNIIEYPAFCPSISADFPRGIPYPSVNYFIIYFIYFPAWIHAYMYHLDELKKLINELKITNQLIEALRKEISKIDPEYQTLLKEQLETIASWCEEDKKVLEQLFDQSYHGKIKFSQSTIFWTS